LGQLAVRFLFKAEIVDTLDGNFLGDFEDLANDIAIVFWVSSSTTPLVVKVLIHPVVSARCQFSVELGKFYHRIHRDLAVLLYQAQG
jgi:hypothetical protein